MSKEAPPASILDGIWYDVSSRTCLAGLIVFLVLVLDMRTLALYLKVGPRISGDFFYRICLRELSLFLHLFRRGRRRLFLGSWARSTSTTPRRGRFSMRKSVESSHLISRAPNKTNNSHRSGGKFRSLVGHLIDRALLSSYAFTP